MWYYLHNFTDVGYFFMNNKHLALNFGAAAHENGTRVLNNQPQDIDLLTRTLDKLFPGNFVADEAAEAPGLIELLRGNSNFSFLVCGTDLHDPQRAEIKGLCVGALFPESGTAALWYLVSDAKYRQQGIGRTLVFDTAAELQRKAHEIGLPELRGLFAHIHDPRLPEASDDPFDPSQRVAFYDRLGAQLARIPHFLSPDPAGVEKSIPYLLVAIPLAPGEPPRVSAAAIHDHAIDYFRHYGVEDPAQHPDFQLMERQLAALGNEPALTPLSVLKQQKQIPALPLPA